MKLTLNGEEVELPEALTVAALLHRLGLPAPQVAVEVNAEVVRRARHAEHVLAAGDKVEVVTFVGGG